MYARRRSGWVRMEPVAPPACTPPAPGGPRRGANATAFRAIVRAGHEKLERYMTLMPQRRWILPRESRVDAPDGIAPLVARILLARGCEVADMPAFIAARAAQDGPPMLDLDRAVARLRRALVARERIVVYGDYDVDGIAGSAVLVRAFRQLGV